MLTRDQFIRRAVSLSALGLSHIEQFEEYRRHFDGLTPHADGLVMVQEIYIGGTAEKSTPAVCRFLRGDDELIRLSVNLFGGVIRWVARADSPLVATEESFHWTTIDAYGEQMWPHGFSAYMVYLGQDGRHRSLPFRPGGRLSLCGDKATLLSVNTPEPPPPELTLPSWPRAVALTGAIE
jgi:hypothetical protein